MSSTPLFRHQDAPLGARLRAALSALPALTDYLALRRQRQALGQLDAHLLRDIGLSEAEARKEATRLDWDVPQNWRG